MASFDDEMHRLSEGLKAMQVAYSRYFTGALDRPPVELQASLAAIIREHTVDTEGQRTAERFRFNSLVSRYHILTEMWNRNVRQIEEGRPSSLDRRGGTQVTAKSTSGEKEMYRARFQTGQSSQENPDMQKLYESYLSAAKAGGTKGTLSYRKFYGQVQRHLEKCQEKTGCDAVVLRVVLVDNRPVLKVKSAS